MRFSRLTLRFVVNADTEVSFNYWLLYAQLIWSRSNDSKEIKRFIDLGEIPTIRFIHLLIRASIIDYPGLGETSQLAPGLL